MHRYRRNEQDGGSDGAADRRQVEHPHRVIERLKALLKRQGEQKPGEQLNTGLNDAQLLKQARPVAVEPLCVGLMALGVVPSAVLLGMVDIDVDASPRPSRRAASVGIWSAIVDSPPATGLPHCRERNARATASSW